MLRQGLCVGVESPELDSLGRRKGGGQGEGEACELDSMLELLLLISNAPLPRMSVSVMHALTCKPLAIMRFSALPPPPPTPMTLMLASPPTGE